MTLSTKRNSIIALGLVTVAGVAFGVMVYRVLAEGKLLTEQVATLEVQRAQENSYYRLQRTAEETTAKREELQGYFLEKESDSIDLLNQVETLAPRVGVTLETDKLELLEEKETKHTWIQAGFTFYGSRQNVQDFIRVLETLPYVLRLTDLDMKAQSSTLWQASATMQVRVVSYEE